MPSMHKISPVVLRIWSLYTGIFSISRIASGPEQMEVETGRWEGCKCQLLWQTKGYLSEMKTVGIIQESLVQVPTFHVPLVVALLCSSLCTLLIETALSRSLIRVTTLLSTAHLPQIMAGNMLLTAGVRFI